jgi:ribose/xylose/arabinose/galactoside ABC-type transport system permease subunit
MPAISRRLEHRGILFAALALEAALFSFLAPSFFTLGNFFEITRLSTELGCSRLR